MASTSRQLDFKDGFIWIRASVLTPNRRLKQFKVVLDTGSKHSILATPTAEALGYPESSKVGDATFDSPDGPVLGYTVRLLSLVALGREVQDYLVGCKIISPRLQVPGILGMDFFTGTDLHILFRSGVVQLDW